MLGEFPYYWLDPRNLEFNETTYGWISAGLKADTTPVQLDQPFTNSYISALSKVTYTLSEADQQALTVARSNIEIKQTAVLQAWKNAFGKIPQPESPHEPIDSIVNSISKQWAVPPTTLQQLQKSTDLKATLNNVPAGGQPVVPVFASYLQALNASESLENNASMNNGYVTQALGAVQAPSSENGGLSTNTGTMQPAYGVATPLQQILDGLNSTDSSNAFTVDVSVSHTSATEYSISIEGGSEFNLPNVGFFDVPEDVIPVGPDPTQVTVTFRGVTIVQFGPVAFQMSAGKNWYWTTPITDAIKNGDKDVSGFKFSPEPQIDFSKSGPFGFLTAVAISQHPTLNITATRNQTQIQEINTDFNSEAGVDLTFLGDLFHLTSIRSDDSNEGSDSRGTLVFEPDAKYSASASVNSRAWVHGVQTEYPAG